MKEIGITWEGTKVFEIDNKTGVTEEGEILSIDPIDNSFLGSDYLCGVLHIDKNTSIDEVKNRIYNPFMIKVGEFTIDIIDGVIDGEEFEIEEDDENKLTLVKYKNINIVMHDNGYTEIECDDKINQEDLIKVNAIVDAFDLNNVEFEDFNKVKNNLDCTNF